MTTTNNLTDAGIRAARPGATPYKLRDGGGLNLLVTPGGAKQWRMRYKTGGRETMLSLGSYPATSLKAARSKSAELSSAIEAGRDPSLERRTSRSSLANTFQAVAREWLERQQFAPKTLTKAQWMFEDLLFPYIGSRPIAELTAPELLVVFRRLERRGKHETAHRIKQRVGQVVRYAVATGRAERDPTANLRGALVPVKVTNRAAITEPRQVAHLLRQIDGYQGSFIVEHALQLAPLVFVRPGELRGAEWSEFDLEGAEWRIGAHRMKMRQMHIVPLARQAVAILREMGYPRVKLNEAALPARLLLAAVLVAIGTVVNAAPADDSFRIGFSVPAWQGVVTLRVVTNRPTTLFGSHWTGSLYVRNVETHKEYRIIDRAPVHFFESLYMGPLPPGGYELIKFEST